MDILHKKSERSTLSKIWLSALSLEIEKGRHFSKPIDERLCLTCNTGEIENEHFLSKCKTYMSDRSKLKIKLSNVLNININLIKCLNSNSLVVLRLISNYVSDCISRSSVLS